MYVLYITTMTRHTGLVAPVMKFLHSKFLDIGLSPSLTTSLPLSLFISPFSLFLRLLLLSNPAIILSNILGLDCSLLVMRWRALLLKAGTQRVSYSTPLCCLCCFLSLSIGPKILSLKSVAL